MQISLVQTNTMPRSKESRFREQKKGLSRLPDNLGSWLFSRSPQRGEQRSPRLGDDRRKRSKHVADYPWLWQAAGRPRRCPRTSSSHSIVALVHKHSWASKGSAAAHARIPRMQIRPSYRLIVSPGPRAPQKTTKKKPKRAHTNIALTPRHGDCGCMMYIRQCHQVVGEYANQRRARRGQPLVNGQDRRKS